MGGCLALVFAQARRPEISGIIVTGPAIRPGFKPPVLKAAVGRILDRLAPGLTLGNELDVAQISSDAAVIKAYKGDPLVHDRISVRWYNDWTRAVDQLFEDSARIPGPILMLHGEKDRLTDPAASRELAERLGSRATYKLWPGSLHELHHEPAKDQVFTEIRVWMDQRLKAGS
jgi:alpha-beta hydrolase superfamily lysophospholipase